MFRLSVNGEQKGICNAAYDTVKILGCQAVGVSALDYRRKCGIPDGTSNMVSLPHYTVEDETEARQLPWLNDDADCSLADISHDTGILKLPPYAIAQYCQAQTPKTIRVLLWEAHGARNAVKRLERQRTEARVLLADEFAQLKAERDSMSRRIVDLEVRCMKNADGSVKGEDDADYWIRMRGAPGNWGPSKLWLSGHGEWDLSGRKPAEPQRSEIAEEESIEMRAIMEGGE